MKQYLIFLIPFLFSCVKDDSKQIILSYSDNLLEKNNLSLNLSKLNNGTYFTPEDSTQYINIFLLNDSVIKFNDSIYEMRKTENVISFMGNRNVSDSNMMNYDFKKLVNNIQKQIKDETPIVFNLYVDTCVDYGGVGSLYHELFLLSLEDVDGINLFGKNNRFISINYSKLFTDQRPPGMKYRGFLYILVNKNIEIMIEGEWGLAFKDIKSSVIEYFTNPNSSEDLPELVTVDKSSCKQKIALLTKLVDGGESNKTKYLTSWNEKYSTVRVLGTYKTLPRHAFIAIQLDNQVKYTNYLRVVDSISGGVLELKNKLCLSKFNKTYQSLKSNLYIENRIKRAIDIVYSNKINPQVYLEKKEIIPLPPAALKDPSITICELETF